jgi:hypothetical protein
VLRINQSVVFATVEYERVSLEWFELEGEKREPANERVGEGRGEGEQRRARYDTVSDALR